MIEKAFEQARQIFRRFFDVIAIFILVLLYLSFPQLIIRTILGFFFFFLPGYSVARFIFRQEKVTFSSAVTYVVMISLSINPFLSNLIQLITIFTAYTSLLAILLFSLPFLIALNLKPKVQVSEKQEMSEADKSFFRSLAFLGAVVISLGLYLVASLNVAAPRGYDIYGHMYIVNNIISSGKAVFRPDLDFLSNFYVFTYAEMSVLTGMSVVSLGLLLQTFLGAVLAIGVFYFAENVTDSSLAAFVGAVLFVAGPPIYANASPYFYYFHPMWVAMALFPFVLAYVHKNLLEDKKGVAGLSPLFITALFLYHLVVGLMFFAVLLVDFILLLLILRRKRLIVNFGKLAILTLLVASVLIIPFLTNITNPFRYVYPEGGLQTLYKMFFGVSAFAFISPTGGWKFFGTYLQEFLLRALPLLVVGIPGLVYLFFRRRTLFALIFSSVLIGLLGIVQPWLGVAFLPQRFTQPLVIFGSTLVGLFISLVAAVPRVHLTKSEYKIKIKIGVSRQIGRVALLFLLFSYIGVTTYLLFYSPARQAVLDAELYLNHDDLLVIEWIDNNIPRNAKILMDQYLQFYFTGVTGRQRQFSITSDKALHEMWDIYPVNVFIGRTDLLKVDVNYIVVSRWCYTTWSFVGKQYFDQHNNLVRIYEHSQYAIYQIVR